jgi:hypothetical protein
MSQTRPGINEHPNRHKEHGAEEVTQWLCQMLDTLSESRP